MDESELEFAQQAIDYLDTVIKGAAAKAGAFYVDTQQALDGHRLCEARPASVAVNGITAGNDFPDWLGGPIGRESYHPNAFGHLLLENAVLAQTHDLTEPMPEASLTAAPPSESGLPILNTPHGSRSAKTTEYDNGLVPDLVYRDTAANLRLDGAKHALPPNAALSLEIHSSPLNLGSFTTDSQGSLSAQVVIPSSFPTGYHTVHLYGADIDSQPVDIFKTLYVAATPGDKDGDGIADSSQSCIGVVISEVDFDQDGIDDACDPDIQEPPVIQDQPARIDKAESSSRSIGAQIIPVVDADFVSDDSAGFDPAVGPEPSVLAANTAKPKVSLADTPTDRTWVYADITGISLAISLLAYLVKH